MIPNQRRSKEYVDAHGFSPFRRWFERQDFRVRAKVSITISRVERGNDGSIKSAGDGLCEMRIDWGPGYRVYFGFDGPTLVILLGGGTKQRQDSDVAAAKVMWADYKRRKKRD
jgi:putative addiction module killer protein